MRWLLLIAMCLGSTPAARAADNRPNIIFLLTDDQRYDTLGASGNPIIRTPNLDTLAAGGVFFDRAYVTTSICAVNRACIFTGQYASAHGIHDFQTSLSPRQLARSYPAMLKAAGYRVGFVGKFGVGTKPVGLFDYDRGFDGQGRYFQEVDGRERHLTELMGDWAIEFLRTHEGDRPLCLSVSFKAPHVQDDDPRQFLYDPALEDMYAEDVIPPVPLSERSFFEALPEFLRTSENRRRWHKRFADDAMYQRSVKGYYRLISGVDLAVGRILRTLRELGMEKNTVILFTSDNGFYLGERGFAGKWFAHEVSIRVPLIVYDPRPDAALPGNAGTRREELVLSIDLAPTMLALAGIEPPAEMDGLSFLPLIRGNAPHWRTEFFYEHLFQHPHIPRSEAVRTQRWKYIRYIDIEPPYEELYDLPTDPHEEHNLAGLDTQEATLRMMREKWRAWRERLR